MKFLVDANVLSEATKASPNTRVVAWLTKHERDIAVDPIILGEIRFGILLLPKGRRRGRHWVLGELFVEVPGNWMSDPVDVVQVGPLSLRVVRAEIVLADRIIGFKHWRTTAYGAQAIALLQVLGPLLDMSLLLDRLRAEDAEDAYAALLALTASLETVGADELDIVLQTLHQPGGTDGEPGTRA